MGRVGRVRAPTTSDRQAYPAIPRPTCQTPSSPRTPMRGGTFGGARERSTRSHTTTRRGVSCGRPMGWCGARQNPKPSFPRGQSSPQPVIPSEAEGPGTVACINGATRNRPRPTVCISPHRGAGRRLRGYGMTLSSPANRGKGPVRLRFSDSGARPVQVPRLRSG